MFCFRGSSLMENDLHMSVWIWQWIQLWLNIKKNWLLFGASLFYVPHSRLLKSQKNNNKMCAASMIWMHNVEFFFCYYLHHILFIHCLYTSIHNFFIYIFFCSSRVAIHKLTYSYSLLLRPNKTTHSTHLAQWCKDEREEKRKKNANWIWNLFFTSFSTISVLFSCHFTLCVICSSLIYNFFYGE